MNVTYYLENIQIENYCSVPDGKHAEIKIAEYLIEQKIVFFDNLLPYVKLTDHYECISNELLCSLVRNLIVPNERMFIRSYSIKEALERVRDAEELQMDFESLYDQNKLFINLKNGIYDINARKIIPHDINRCFDYCLNFSYIPEGKRKLETFRNYIETSIGNENKECLMRGIGAAFSSVRDFKKALLILGAHDSGKSKLLDVVEEAVGKQYVTCKAFDKIGSEKAIASYSGGKRINISRDVKLGVINEDAGFKSVISCEEITGRLLYQNEIAVTPRVMCIAASNAFPRFRNADDASLKRLVVIKIKGYKGEPDPKLAEKLLAEKDFICSMAVDTLKDFIESGYDFCMSEESKKILEQEKAKLHTTENFISENYDIDSSGSVSSKKLYEHYSSWCNENALTGLGKNTFYDEIRMIDPVISYKKVFNGSGYVWGFEGLKRKSNELLVKRR
ncbi:MAG: phage/plasmid primase, P4 family [Porcipelethomonas sp.]